ncbi:helix-turn-helix transcriptional regulator [Nocardia sp. NPDC050712]|uniref:helix-turn-helix domain-containing protein n=1 Tax=Nocardia sp. NPDC050712 TaxID=3155518 RepID=UPI0033EAD3AB
MATNARGTGALTEAVAEEMRALLGARNMNQAALSRATGIHKATVSSMLNARTAIDVEQIAAIATALGVDPSELMRSALERYHRIIGSNPGADDSDVGPLLTSTGSVMARSTDEQHAEITEWARSRAEQARGSSTPSPPREPSSTEDP